MAFPVGPVIYSIFVNGTQVRDYPLDVELRQQWGNHDLFIIRTEIPRLYTKLSTEQLWPENSPVSIVWGRRPDNITTWYGYVNHTSFDGNSASGSKASQVTYTLIGTSKPMNTDRTKTWGQVTGTYIARTIFSSYGLRSILTNTNWILPYEVQANESDFCFLNRIADKIGFRLWVSGSTGYFTDPSVVLTTTATQGVPSYSLDKRFTQVDTIRQFNTNYGDNLPGVTKTKRVIFGIDPASGNIIQAKATTDQTPSITQVFSDWPISDYNTAKNLVQAKQQRSQFWMTATAELFGSTYIYPGKLVYLTGQQLPGVNQGYWLVGSACHILKASGTSVGSYDKYLTQVTLLRNESTVAPNLSTLPNTIPESVPCQLLNNQWQATQATIYYNGNQSV